MRLDGIQKPGVTGPTCCNDSTVLSLPKPTDSPCAAPSLLHQQKEDTGIASGSFADYLQQRRSLSPDTLLIEAESELLEEEQVRWQSFLQGVLSTKRLNSPRSSWDVSHLASQPGT